MAEVGRPTKMTPDTLRKLEEVFAIGGSDSEACFYADISKETLYAYQREHPEFTDRKEALKEKPILKARQAVVKGLDNYQNAMDYLKRKRKKEFGDKVELSGDEAHPILVKFIDEDNKYPSRV
jgi:NADH:ubiquinone oxidoreductase subunit E